MDKIFYIFIRVIGTVCTKGSLLMSVPDQRVFMSKYCKADTARLRLLVFKDITGDHAGITCTLKQSWLNQF